MNYPILKAFIIWNCSMRVIKLDSSRPFSLYELCELIKQQAEGNLRVDVLPPRLHLFGHNAAQVGQGIVTVQSNSFFRVNLQALNRPGTVIHLSPDVASDSIFCAVLYPTLSLGYLPLKAIAWLFTRGLERRIARLLVAADGENESRKLEPVQAIGGKPPHVFSTGDALHLVHPWPAVVLDIVRIALGLFFLSGVYSANARGELRGSVLSIIHLVDWIAVCTLIGIGPTFLAGGIARLVKRPIPLKYQGALFLLIVFAFVLIESARDFQNRGFEAFSWKSENHRFPDTVMETTSEAMQVEQTTPGMDWNVAGKVESLAFSPDGLTLATLAPNQPVGIWNLASRSQVLSGYSNEGKSKIDFSPDGQMLCAINSDFSGVRSWSTETGELIRSYDDRGVRLNCFALSHNGRWIVTCHGDQSIVYVWDLGSGRQIQVLRSSEKVNCVAFDPDDRHLVFGSRGNYIGQLDMADVMSQWERAAFNNTEAYCEVQELVVGIGGSVSGSIEHLVFSSDGQLLYSASGNDPIRVWSVDPFELVATLDEYQRGVRSLAVDRDSRWLLVIPVDEGPVDLWDSLGKTKLRSFKGHQGQVLCAAFSPDGRTIATSGDDQTVRLWDAETGESIDVKF